MQRSCCTAGPSTGGHGGTGWSRTPGERHSSDQFATDLLALLDALDLDRVDLGHDSRAFTGYKACLQAPERFRRFVAMSAPSPHLR